MFCEKCGHKNVDNAKFCESCGSKIPDSSLGNAFNSDQADKIQEDSFDNQRENQNFKNNFNDQFNNQRPEDNFSNYNTNYNSNYNQGQYGSDFYQDQEEKKQKYLKYGLIGLGVLSCLLIAIFIFRDEDKKVDNIAKNPKSKIEEQANSAKNEDNNERDDEEQSNKPQELDEFVGASLDYYKAIESGKEKKWKKLIGSSCDPKNAEFLFEYFKENRSSLENYYRELAEENGQDPTESVANANFLVKEISGQILSNGQNFNRISIEKENREFTNAFEKSNFYFFENAEGIYEPVFNYESRLIVTGPELKEIQFTYIDYAIDPDEYEQALNNLKTVSLNAKDYLVSQENKDLFYQLGYDYSDKNVYIFPFLSYMELPIEVYDCKMISASGEEKNLLEYTDEGYLDLYGICNYIDYYTGFEYENNPANDISSKIYDSLYSRDIDIEIESLEKLLGRNYVQAYATSEINLLELIENEYDLSKIAILGETHYTMTMRGAELFGY